MKSRVEVILSLLLIMVLLVSCGSSTLDTKESSNVEMNNAEKSIDTTDETNDISDSADSESEISENTNTEETVNIQFDVEYSTNLLFSKYDIEVSIDGAVIGTVHNGDFFKQQYDVAPGKHLLSFSEKGKSDNKLETTIEVNNSIVYTCILFSYKDRIEISEERIIDAADDASLKMEDFCGMVLTDAVKALEDKGCKNVLCVPGGSHFMILDRSNWTVESQTPDAGESISRDTEIKLVCIKTSEYNKSGSSTVESETEDSVVEDISDYDEEYENSYDTTEYTGDTQNNSKLMELKGKPVARAKKEAKKIGYKAFFKHSVTDMDYSYGTIKFTWPGKKLKTVIVTEVGEIDSDEKSVVFYFDSKENIKEENKNDKIEKRLRKKLDPICAWQAVKTYGKREYGRSFKLHYLTQMYAETVYNKNTWFLKAGCTIKQYGEKYDCICEAKVSGTSDNPSIKSFNIY